VDQGVDACDETDGSPRKAMRLKGHTVLNICFNCLENVDFISVFNESVGESDSPDMELSEVNEEKDIPIVLFGEINYLQQLNICLFLSFVFLINFLVMIW
jgi:hypothetical protein